LRKDIEELEDEYESVIDNDEDDEGYSDSIDSGRIYQPEFDHGEKWDNPGVVNTLPAPTPRPRPGKGK
jgi:hypothetical protein